MRVTSSTSNTSNPVEVDCTGRFTGHGTLAGWYVWNFWQSLYRSIDLPLRGERGRRA